MDGSLFGKLSAELRNKIYLLALAAPDESEDDSMINYLATDKPALLRTCKRIREEATLLYYANNAFGASIVDGDIRPFLQLLQLLSKEEAKVISTLHIQLIATNDPYHSWIAIDEYHLCGRVAAAGFRREAVIWHATRSKGALFEFVRHSTDEYTCVEILKTCLDEAFEELVFEESVVEHLPTKEMSIEGLEGLEKFSIGELGTGDQTDMGERIWFSR